MNKFNIGDRVRAVKKCSDGNDYVEPTPKPFPTFEEFDEWFYLRWDSEMKTLYNYFAQFGVREVFPEVGKEYEFEFKSGIKKIGILYGYWIKDSGVAAIIRPIQPSRLEQLKAKHPNLTNDELIELLDILLTQMRK